MTQNEGVERADGTPASTPADVRRAREELWQLAQSASQYLRRHVSPAVRLATALLLAASLAACNASASEPAVVESPAVAPLQQEIATGLPRGPGTYPVAPQSVFRDQRGVYQLEWLEPGQSDVPGQVAHVSRLRLLRGEPLSLEIVSGEDPVLHLPEAENVGLIQESQVGATQPGPSYHPQPYGFWSPFAVGYLLGGMRPAYYDPPRTVVVTQAPATGAGTAGQAGSVTRVEGGTVSETARPPAQRVSGVRTAVSGRAGGTGAGNAVSSRNAAGNPSGSGSSGAVGSAAGASSATGAGSAASSGSGGSSVSPPRSGGFSAGQGSSSGSAAS